MPFQLTHRGATSWDLPTNLNWKPGGAAIAVLPVWMKPVSYTLAGPVVAAAVILPTRCRLVGVDDSKRVSESERSRLYEVIVQRARAVGVGVATEQEIDRLNILEATRLAMRRALASLTPPADCLLIDAVTLPDLAVPSRSIIKGDTLSLSIAAASIVAKVVRDRMMMAYHLTYPEYNFFSHKGYGTEEHLQRLAQHGPCAIHRRTFAPVAQFLGGHGGAEPLSWTGLGESFRTIQ